MFLHLSPFRAIAPSGELLLGPSRSSATTASTPSAAASLPSSLLASSCSGPSRQDERTTARLIPSPGIGHDLLAGIWEGGFTPGTPVSTQRQKMSERHKYRKETFSSVVFPRALRFPHRS